MNLKIHTQGMGMLTSLGMFGILVLSACSPIPVTGPTAIPPQALTPFPTPNPSIPSAVLPTPAAGEPVAVAKYDIELYSGPGTNYVVYAALLGGRAAKVVGKSQAGNWWAVSMPVAPGGTGWVNAQWVTLSGTDSVPVLPTPPVPPSTEMVPPGPNDPQVTALANVFVRSGPSNNYPAYGIAPQGMTARVIGKSEDGQWWVVRLDPAKVGAGYGWVMAQTTQTKNVDAANLQTIQSPINPPAIPLTTSQSGTAMAKALQFVNVRSGPGANYPVLGVAAPEATAQITGKSADGNWWQVVVPTRFTPDGKGWVLAGYVAAINTNSVPVVPAPPLPTVTQPTKLPPDNTACQLVSQSPANGTSFAPGTAFSATWALKNTGAGKWDQNEVDARYLGAANNVPLHQGTDNYDLTATVQPGDTFNFTVQMIAPSDPGTYGEMWELTLGSLGPDQTCQFYLFINVK